MAASTKQKKASAAAKSATDSAAIGAAAESMTGYGEHRARLCGMTVVCRTRSVNHRFLDLKIRVPRSDLMTLELAVRRRASEVFKRGSIEISVLVETAREATSAKINLKTVADYDRQSRAIAKKLKIKAATLDAILRLPGVIESGVDASNSLPDEATEEMIMDQLIEPALHALKTARKTEGLKLTQILVKLLDEMNQHVLQIGMLEGPEKEKARTQIVARGQETLKLLNSLGANAQRTDEFATRLREEAVFWIERRDFTEERERLAMHLEEFRRVLTGIAAKSPSSSEASGRKLEFLQQEILREINTLGTKAQSTAITTHTIELKTILERVREQLANVE